MPSMEEFQLIAQENIHFSPLDFGFHLAANLMTQF